MTPWGLLRTQRILVSSVAKICWWKNDLPAQRHPTPLLSVSDQIYFLYISVPQIQWVPLILRPKPLLVIMASLYIIPPQLWLHGRQPIFFISSSPALGGSGLLEISLRMTVIRETMFPLLQVNDWTVLVVNLNCCVHLRLSPAGFYPWLMEDCSSKWWMEITTESFLKALSLKQFHTFNCVQNSLVWKLV